MGCNGLGKALKCVNCDFRMGIIDKMPEECYVPDKPGTKCGCGDGNYITLKPEGSGCGCGDASDGSCGGVESTGCGCDGTSKKIVLYHL